MDYMSNIHIRLCVVCATALSLFVFTAPNVHAAPLPSLEASYFGGKSDRISELAKVAGPDWRAIAANSARASRAW